MKVRSSKGWGGARRASRAVWLGVFALAATAQAADLSLDAAGTIKDPLPDSLTWHGVTVYGTIDVGYAYQTHGVPLNGSFYPGLEYDLNGSKNANRAISSFSQSGIEQSKVGVKFEEPLVSDWKAIGKFEAAFDPIGGVIADMCASMVQNNGKPYAAQNANSDGSRCGQAFSGPAYGGISNPAYGTLTVGRQQSLMLDAVQAYDPNQGSYAFSLIGYSNGTASGIGATETARWDNSVKYIYQIGPAHAAVMYTGGGQDTAIFNGAYGFNVGGTWRGFSLDANYTKENGTVVSTAIPYLGYSASGCLAGSCPDGLAATISDNEAWSVMGKYALDIGGGLKDEAASAKLTFFAGYAHIDLSNPRDRNIPAGSTTIGGYELASVTTNAYTTDKILQTAWTGARYELPGGLSFSLAYYHYGQGDYINNKGKNCAAALPSPVGNPTPANCSGFLDQVSFMTDYAFSKHLDIYAGVSYEQNGGGLASGYLNTNMATFMSGVRLKF